MVDRIDLGHEHRAYFTSWAPDRDLNPQFDGIEDVEKFGLVVEHPNKTTGQPCVGAITFDTPTARRLNVRENGMWQVESFEPLTLSPSLLCSCGDHGFIRNGRWEPC